MSVRLADEDPLFLAGHFPSNTRNDKAIFSLTRSSESHICCQDFSSVACQCDIIRC